MVPKDVLNKWIKYLNQFYPTYSFSNSSVQEKVGLLHALKGEHSLKNLKRALQVGLFGYPNSGKSSLINFVSSGSNNYNYYVIAFYCK